MKATFLDEDAWLRAIASMVREGVTFEAIFNGTAWVIEFTGGY